MFVTANFRHEKASFNGTANSSAGLNQLTCKVIMANLLKKLNSFYMLITPMQTHRGSCEHEIINT